MPMGLYGVSLTGWQSELSLLLAVSLRAFLRFLRVTGKLSMDLASGVLAPRYRIDELPRILP
jgi:hypothetical protein